jgi:SAM-dependent methyltransferase
MKLDISNLPSIFVCPKCKSTFHYKDTKLVCSNCLNEYHENKNLINFIPKEYWNEKENITLLKKAYSIFFNMLGPIYESDVWYQWTLNASGAKGNSIKSITEFMEKTLGNIEGNIIDVACGTATYGRRIVTKNRTIYGLDFSSGMLAQGMRYIEKQGIDNVCLVQGTAEYLPYQDEAFSAAICAGSLHLFNNPSRVLKEIGRVLKPKSIIALQTFISNSKDGTINLKEKTGFHFFYSSNLEKLLSLSGYKEIEIALVGTVLYGKALVNK